MKQTAYLTELWTDLNRISICICCDHIICKFWRIWHRNKVSKLSLIYQSTSEITSTPFEWTEKWRIDTMNLISINLHLIQRQLAKRSCSKYVASEVKSFYLPNLALHTYLFSTFVSFFFCSCWLSVQKGTIWSFVVPVILIALVWKFPIYLFPFPSTYGDNGLTFLSLFP